MLLEPNLAQRLRLLAIILWSASKRSSCDLSRGAAFLFPPPLWVPLWGRVRERGGGNGSARGYPSPQPSPTRGEGADRARGESTRIARQCRINCLGFNFQRARKPMAVIPGWSAGPDLRCAIAHRGISRFRVRCVASPRNDGVWVASSPQRRQTQIHKPKSTYGFALATRCARAVHLSSALGGRGECRVPVAPAVSCALVLVERTRVTTSTPESPDIPARHGFNSLCRALPGDRALCHRHQRICFV
jgi:hypothetical protein